MICVLFMVSIGAAAARGTGARRAKVGPTARHWRQQESRWRVWRATRAALVVARACAACPMCTVLRCSPQTSPAVYCVSSLH